MTGEVACMDCAMGTYSNMTGQAACMDCAMGTYGNMTGQADCIVCAVDSYANSTGSTSCTACEEGTCTEGYTGAPVCVTCDDDGSGMLERTTIVTLSVMALIMMWQ